MKWNSVCQGLEGGGVGEIVFNRGKAQMWEGEKFLGMDAGDGCTM